MSSIDGHRGHLTREQWLNSLIRMRIRQLDEIQARDYQTHGKPSFAGFVGVAVQQLPATVGPPHVSQTHVALQEREARKTLQKALTFQPELAHEPDAPVPAVPQPEPQPHVHSNGQMVAKTPSSVRYRCLDPTCDWVSGWLPT
jgi:hypothetical protein